MPPLSFISWALALCIMTFPALAFSLANAGCRVRTMNSGARGLMMSVGKKDSYNIALLPGDGIGPEISKATQNALSPLEDRFKLNFCEGLVGGAAVDATGTPWPGESADLSKSSDSVLFGAIGGPKWDQLERAKRPETGLLAMRKELGLFANIRPVKAIGGLTDASTLKREVVDGVDLVVVRELTGDVYFGEPKGQKIEGGERVGYNNMIYREHEIRRIARVAFDLAEKRSGRVCSVDKSNVLDVMQLWRDVVTEEAASRPGIQLTHMLVDNAAMQLIRQPKQFDVIVTGNMFGDILSDESSMLCGSLGMLPSASVGDSLKPGVFEPIHGSAPDLAGKDLANPLAMILSAAMMLRLDLDRAEEATLVEKAVDHTLSNGYATHDIERRGCKLLGCEAMGNYVAEELAKLLRKH